MNEVRQTTLPFSGFYHSSHSELLDSTLHYMFADETGNTNVELTDRAFSNVNWTKVHEEYAKIYAENFAGMFNLETLAFKDLVSPKYYNYETDRLFCEISLDEVASIYEKVDKNRLRALIKEKFTSYDGYISFYPNDLHEWPYDLKDWDHNHIGTLLEAYVLQEGFEQSEVAIMDDPFEQCYYILTDNMKDAERLLKIRNYLNERNARE